MHNDPVGDHQPDEENESLIPEADTPRKSSRTKRFGCMGMILLSIFGCFEFFEITRCGNGQIPECRNNLSNLGIALHNYHDAFELYHRLDIADENGKPMHSWRVLLLPQLEANDLYKQYRFDEPWDGPNNRKLHDKMPRAFQCPSDKHGHDNQFTNYVVVAGKNTAWPYAKTVNFNEMKDGLILSSSWR